MTTSNATGNGLQAAMLDAEQQRQFPVPPTFDSKLEEREYLKFRLAQAFRIFGIHIILLSPICMLRFSQGQLRYNEGVAGHITVRVRLSNTPSVISCL